MLSMPTTYQMMVRAIESQAGVSLEVAQNRLLEEWRKRKGQFKGGLLMTALHSKIPKLTAAKQVIPARIYPTAR